MDVVSQIQEEFLRFGQTFANALEAVPQCHVPPPAPPPPAGVDPNVHYQQYWAKHLQEHPFRTRGFIEGSDEAADDAERWNKSGEAIMSSLERIDGLLGRDGLQRTEAEQLKRFEELNAENQSSRAELEGAVENAQGFLKELRALYKKVATEYIEL